MKGKLRIFLDVAYFDQAIDKIAFSGEEHILKGRFLMLLQSQVSLYWNISKSDFIDLAQSNPYYKVLFKKEFEGQVVSHFQADLGTFLHDDRDSPSVLFVASDYVDLSDNPNIQLCRSSTFYADLDRIFLHAKFKAEYDKLQKAELNTQRAQFLNEIQTRCVSLLSDRVILNDGYLLHESGTRIIDSVLNLKSWLKSVTSSAKEAFFCYGHDEDQEDTYELLEGMNDFEKVGLINGKIHNRFLLTRFFYLSSGIGFNAFDESGSAIRKDEFTLESVYMPKDKAGDSSAYQRYFSWFKEVKRQVDNYHQGIYPYLHLEGECFFDE